MVTLSYRTLGAVVAGAVVAGWLSASVATPPRVVSQELPGRRARAADVAAIPTLVLDVAGRATPRPASGRNPFTFGGTRASEPVGAAAIADGRARAVAPRPEAALAPGPRGARARMATVAAAGRSAGQAGP
ncbi:MAG: hypothetical protein AB7O28_22745, partial [Vicinamibacterales bacterium]